MSMSAAPYWLFFLLLTCLAISLSIFRRRYSGPGHGESEPEPITAMANCLSDLQCRREHSAKLIAEYKFPASLLEGILANSKSFKGEQSMLAITALRSYFVAVSCQVNLSVSLPVPSATILVMLKNFATSKKIYSNFCELIYSHPIIIPEQVEVDPLRLGRTWHYASLAEGNNPFRSDAAIPLLFRLDLMLETKNGVIFSQEDYEKIRRSLLRFHG